MKLLGAYLKHYWPLVALALVLAAINQIFSLLDPLIFRYVIDEYATKYQQYTTEEFFRGVSMLLAAAVGVAFVSRVAKNFQDYYINVITQRLGARIYSDGIRHSLELPYSVFEDQRSGETLGKLQKVRTDVEKLLTVSINVLFTSLVGVIFVVIYAFSVHWVIAPVYFMTVPLLGVLSSVLSRKIKIIQKVIVAETTALAGSTTESLRNIINVYREAEVSLKNFEDILAIPKEPRPSNPVPLPDLHRLGFDTVSFKHQSASFPALTDITFEAARGDTIAFVGPSGAGKTTLVKLLVGLYRPQSGEILYNGQPAATIDLDQLRERIGFVTQDTQLFSGTIRENLLFVNPAATDADCLDVLRQAACDSLLARADRGLDTVIGEGGVNVSGGEKQRLSIARALLRHPHLLVFDEATSSLDSLTEEEIGATIRDVATSQNVITILIAHRLSTIMHADRIFVLERGRVVEFGSHDALIAQKGLYYAMWRQQIGERRAAPAPMLPQQPALAR
ncbi:MAG TPA: ABC transporter ATP-binding protein [Vicinamibacterales bacterium]|nr:ABC transporter ATP-binding protein [Vicinamibacterales bacterium]